MVHQLKQFQIGKYQGGASALITCAAFTSHNNILICVYLNSMLQIVDPVIYVTHHKKIIAKHFGVKH
jgi:hypothetical protein